MKKKKAKAIKKAGIKAKRKDLKATIAAELKQITDKLGSSTKKVEKTIRKAAEKLAKELKIDAISIVEPAGQNVTKEKIVAVDAPQQKTANVKPTRITKKIS